MDLDLSPAGAMEALTDQTDDDAGHEKCARLNPIERLIERKKGTLNPDQNQRAQRDQTGGQQARAQTTDIRGKSDGNDAQDQGALIANPGARRSAQKHGGSGDHHRPPIGSPGRGTAANGEVDCHARPTHRRRCGSGGVVMGENDRPIHLHPRATVWTARTMARPAARGNDVRHHGDRGAPAGSLRLKRSGNCSST
jgi:hypothetical protein